MAQLIKVEYTCKTSQAIYANVTYVNFFGVPKTKEAFIHIFKDRSYSSFPKWVKNGNDTPMSEAIKKEMIRQYELNQNKS